MTNKKADGMTATGQTLEETSAPGQKVWRKPTM